MNVIEGKQQFVSFPFFKLDPAWRRLPEAERTRGKNEFREVIEASREMIVLPYSVIGVRGDSDFFFWRVSYQLEDFESQTAQLLNTGLGKYTGNCRAGGARAVGASACARRRRRRAPRRALRRIERRLRRA